MTDQKKTHMKCLSIYNDRYRKSKRDACIERLGNKCQDCNKTYPAVCYDFHHIDENKDDNVADLIRNNKKLETIFEEVDKCVLLCSNCHRQRHFA
jgi:hypothetical protein